MNEFVPLVNGMVGIVFFSAFYICYKLVKYDD